MIVKLLRQRVVRIVFSNYSVMPVNSNFTILYGSQTGQAKAIAEEIHEQSENHGLCSKLLCLSLTDKKFTIDKENLVVFVVSTTGEGDPPDTMSKFMRRLKKKTLPSNYLENCYFALLALGDTNYTNFCNCGKSLDKRMLSLGAKHFYETNYADDAVGLELVVEPWIEGLWPALKKQLGDQGNGLSNSLENTSVNHQLSVDETSTLNNAKVNIQNRPDIVESSTAKSLDTGSISSEHPVTVIRSGALEHATDTNKVHESENMAESDLSVDKKNGFSAVKEQSHADDEECKPAEERNEKDLPSLQNSQAPLSTSSLSIPQLPAAYLTLDFHPDKGFNPDSAPLQEVPSFPGATTAVSMATIASARRLTTDMAVKKAIDIELDVTGCNLRYEPGDSFGIICPNDAEEVHTLIERLGLVKESDVPFTLKVLESTSKKTAKVPEYIPQLCTIRHALTTCLEIRSVPKKALLRVLVEYASDPCEKRRLQELCSKQGMADYSRFIRDSSISVLDILHAFPSCNPPFERLLEHLPRLMPRLYSVASSPLQTPGHLHFLFNIVEFPALLGVREKRLGVCTGWLNRLTVTLQDAPDKHAPKPVDELSEGLTRLQLSGESKVPVFGRKNLHFKLPENPATPVLMIGPGTGVAPFIGFLQHREHQRKNCGSASFGPMWLFFGCRHKHRDFLYRDELEQQLSMGVLTKLFVSFSRDDQESAEARSLPRYVQHNLQLHSAEVADLIFNQGAVIYICGDAKNMARNVLETFLEIFQQHKGISLEEARKELLRLRTEERYHEDIWT